MLKGTILYIIALYLLGQAVAKLMEEQYNEGVATNQHLSFNRGWQAHQSLVNNLKAAGVDISDDVHREP